MEDSRARRVTSLPAAGLGHRRVAADRPTWGRLFAMTAGIGAPLAMALFLYTGLPLAAWLAAGALALGVIVLSVRRSRAARRRAAARAAERTSRGQARTP